MWFLKWAEDLNRHFPKEEVNRYMKRCSTSLIREMQIKTIMRYQICLNTYYLKDSNKWWQGCETTGTFRYSSGNVKSLSLLWKIVWEYLAKLSICIPCKPAISLPCIPPNKNADICSPKDTCNNVHSSSLQNTSKLETSPMPTESRTH